MADPLHASTETPKQAPGGFPPFKTETFPSQIFWLVVCFAFLFVVLWRVAGPRINGVITSRRSTINADIAAADQARGDAEQASADRGPTSEVRGRKSELRAAMAILRWQVSRQIRQQLPAAPIKEHTARPAAFQPLTQPQAVT